MTRIVDITGQPFGKLVVIGRAPGPTGKSAHWECRCACGGTTIARGDNLRRHRTTHCGCEIPGHLRRNLAQGRITRISRARGRKRMSVPDMAELLAKRLAASQGVMLTAGQREAVRAAYR